MKYLRITTYAIIFIALFSVAQSAQAAIALVNNTGRVASNTTSSMDTTGANFLIVGCHYWGTASFTVSDNKSNTWHALTAYGVNDDNGYIRLYYAYENVNVGTGHTFTCPTGSYMGITASAFSGVLTSSDPLDSGTDHGSTSWSLNGSTYSIQAGSVTPSQTGELLIAAYSNGYGSSNAANPQIDNSFSITNFVHDGASMDGGMAYLVDSNTNAINPTWSDTISGGDPIHFSAAIAAFKPEITTVYYSVGQNADNHSSGGNVVITSGGVATFDTPQVATNLGVGDRLTYGGHIAYLKTKTDTTHWTVVTKLGVAADNHDSVAVTSIAHEYTSLSAAEAGAADANHINNTSLTAADVILNIPCYYDDAADTTAVTVDGWTTDATRYIKIYTPNLTTESNVSQRHDGKWNTNKYRLEITASGQYQRIISIADEYTKVDGLQLKINSTYNDTEAILVGSNWSAGNNDVWISNSIVRGNYSGGSTGQHGIDCYGGDADARCKIYNNIVYDFIHGTGIVSYGHAYNNTVNDSAIGFSGGNLVVKNNLALNNTTDYSGTFDSSSTYNLSSDDTASTVIGVGVTYPNSTVVFVDADNKNFHLDATS